MKVLASWIQKGGTGKSTLTGNLSYFLKERGKTLIVDADPQGNLSGWLHPEPFKNELADILKGNINLPEAVLNLRPGLDMIGTFAIGGGLKNWAETTLPSRPFAFHDLREQMEKAGYDYVILDMSPGISILERSIIAVCDEVLPVVKPEYFAVDGLEVFSITLDSIRKELRSKVITPRIVINAINMSFGVHKAYYEEVKKLPFDVFTIGQTTKATEAQTAHKFLSEYDPSNKALIEYQRLAEAV